MTARLVVADYGMGNIGSVVNAFATLGTDCTVSGDPVVVREAGAIVLPGVGAFHAAMDNIRALGLDEALTDAVMARRTPFLGICLGLQLIAKDSVEYGHTNGLGWIDAHVVPLEPAGGLPVPHVGWNEVGYPSNAPMFVKTGERPHFYFDHSFGLEAVADGVVATVDYGGRWAAAVERDNIFAVQFHPEKSQRTGLRLLRNFLNSIPADRC